MEKKYKYNLLTISSTFFTLKKGIRQMQNNAEYVLTHKIEFNFIKL